MVLSQRRSGVLLHISSLPGPHGLGDLGPSAHRFVDWLAEAGHNSVFGSAERSFLLYGAASVFCLKIQLPSWLRVLRPSPGYYSVLAASRGERCSVAANWLIACCVRSFGAASRPEVSFALPDFAGQGKTKAIERSLV